MGLERRLLTLLGDLDVDLLPDVLVGLLDQRRVDAAVGDQALERLARDLAANAVEARQHDRGGRLVDDHVDAGELLQRPDVAPVAADDPALHLVVGQLDQPGGRLVRVLGSEPVHGDGEDAARASLGLRGGLGLDLLQAQAGLVAGLLLDLRDQEVFRLRSAEPGDALQLAPLDPLCLLELLGLLDEVALAVLQRLQTALDVGSLDGERLGLQQRPLLHPGDLLAPGAELVGGPGDGAVARRPALRLGRTRLGIGAVAPPR